MREGLYRLLVSRVPGIRERFLQCRQSGIGKYRFVSIAYLLWLNICYYLLQQKHLGESLRYPYYEERKLYKKGSESALSVQMPPRALAEKLAAYDVISFDVFDTLLLRPFSNPADLFYLVGIRLGYPGFRQIRIEEEERAREKKRRRAHTGEVTLREIWEQVQEKTGIPVKEGMQAEWETEQRCCRANPYMLQVVQELRKRGKKLVILSDMYLGVDKIRALLMQCGYEPFDAYYVSCDFGKSKAEGGLYRTMLSEQLKAEGGPRVIHVGDNRQSDIRQARRAGLKTFYYPNINRSGGPFRPQDMSAVTGSLYRGIVNAQIHGGLSVFSQEYEFGFIYGGLFVAGYCRFIYNYAKRNGIERLLFLARDGDVLLRAYRRMYPQEKENTVYAYWSRLAAVKITAEYYRSEYFQRFLYHKVNQGYTIRRILREMELTVLLQPLCRAGKITPETELTNRNVEYVREYLTAAWRQVTMRYQEQREAAGIYFGRILKDCRRAAAVDVGWAGSGAWMLDCAVQNIWKLGCSVTGILAGTTTGKSTEPDAAEPAMMSGRMVSYLYSPQENRDIWKYHNPDKKHNLFWELLLGSPQGSLKGFYFGRDGRALVRLKKNHTDQERIREIHRGILDFIDCFLETEKRIGQEIPVGGRDAYAPMLSICSPKNRGYMKRMEGLLDDVYIG